MRTSHTGALVLLLVSAAASGRARATYSIVASDMRTRQVGGAGASCVYPSQVSVIYGVAPGFGAVHAQAQSNAAGRDRAVQLLREGRSASEVLGVITMMSFDAQLARRQYGVIDVTGGSAGFTGAQNMMFADDRQGSALGYVYSVQGNILTGAALLQRAATAFESDGCDLAERLMQALEAGALEGEGDSRCVTASGIPANSAFIQVDLPDMPAGSYLRLSAGSGAGNDPLPALRRSFDAWRASHPCASRPAGDAGTSAPDAAASLLDGAIASDASAGAGLPRDAASDADGRGSEPTPRADERSDAASMAGPVVSVAGDASDRSPDAVSAVGAAASATDPARDTGPREEDGCSFQPAGAQRSGVGWLAIAVALLLWRRRRA